MSALGDVADDGGRNNDKRWHVGREVPIAVLFVLVLQTGGGVWWLAQFSSKLDYAIDQLRTFQSERYTSTDARHDKELMMQIVEGLRQKDAEYERRITTLEGMPRRGLQ